MHYKNLAKKNENKNKNTNELDRKQDIISYEQNTCSDAVSENLTSHGGECYNHFS